VLEGTVTKVVAFGAFVEILPGVEGLVHISELADHHVENPSEVVEPGSKLNVKILEIDEERRRLSLSIKRVEGQNMPMGDLGAQIAAAEGDPPEGEAPVAEDDGAQSAGPVADEDPSSSQAAGEAPSSAPPAEDAPETDETAPSVEAPEAPAAEETPEEPVVEEASESTDPAPVAEENGDAEEGDGGEAQEGETVADRPDSPDDVDEDAGEDAGTGESEQG
jgi:small subunit ribosomal protein S1